MVGRLFRKNDTTVKEMFEKTSVSVKTHIGTLN